MDNEKKNQFANCDARIPVPFRVAGGKVVEIFPDFTVCREISGCPETVLWKRLPPAFTDLKLTLQPKPLYVVKSVAQARGLNTVYEVEGALRASCCSVSFYSLGSTILSLLYSATQQQCCPCEASTVMLHTKDRCAWRADVESSDVNGRIMLKLPRCTCWCCVDNQNLTGEFKMISVDGFLTLLLSVTSARFPVGLLKQCAKVNTCLGISVGFCPENGRCESDT